MKFNWVPNSTSVAIVGVDLVKKHLYISSNEYDDLINAYILAASKEIEAKVGYPITQTNVIVYTDDLTLPANLTVTKYEYLNGKTWTEQILTGVNVVANRLTKQLMHDDFVKNKYKLTCNTSLTTNEVLKQAVMLLVGEMFENRENREVKTYNKQIDFLISNESIFC